MASSGWLTAFRTWYSRLSLAKKLTGIGVISSTDILASEVEAEDATA